MGLIYDAVRTTAAAHVAQFMHLVNKGLDKLEEEEKQQQPVDESGTTSTIVDFEKPELLNGQVIARRFKFGFNSDPTNGPGN